MKAFNKVLILGHYTVNDPTTVNTIKSFANQSQQVLMVQQSENRNQSLDAFSNLKIHRLYNFRHFTFLKGANSLLRSWYYRLRLKWIMLRYQPDLVVSFMLYPLAALNPGKNKTYKLLCCIYDIPSVLNAGKLDRVLNRKAWAVLKNADLVWASDQPKAVLAREFGELAQLPLVCHNCPPAAGNKYEPGKRSNWLRQQLMQAGAPISLQKGCVLLRAGAIGAFGGIEETLEIMHRLPGDFVFLMMGRPDAAYKKELLLKIEQLGLQTRAILWDRPDDASWQQAIEGADIGHLLHLEPQDPVIAEAYQLNSSLSNYRLFNYMAAGLPILSYDDARLDAIHQEVNCFSVVKRAQVCESIYENLLKLCTDKAYREARGEAAYQGFMNTYNWEKQFAPVLKSISHVCNPQSSS